MRGLAILGAVLLLAGGCADDSISDAGGGGGVDAGTGPVDAGGGSADAGGGSVDAGGGQVDAGGVDVDGGGTDGGMMMPPDSVRFVVMGDVGEGNDDQRAVARQIESYCAVEGCDFVILLGDNIYDAGVESVDDPQWRMKFETPYMNLELPFYAVLGNHDYGGVLGVCPLCTESGGLGNEWERGPIEVMYTDHSEKWTMPATHYTLQMGNVGFVMLDTNSILWDDTTHGDQRAWYDGAVAELRASGAEWIIAAGHHPYLSNGAHGNAGTYESIEVGGSDIPIPVPILDGANVLDFFDSYVCGDADVYLAGHDHNRQWIDEPMACAGTELIVSGAGAKVTDLRDPERNGTFFQDDTTPGFMHVVIDGDTMIGRFIDRDGAVGLERMISR